MPRLWTETIETHRREVREAVVDAASALVARYGLRGVTMSQIAEKAGIGRATLYKYFPDVESILLAWHERKVAGHLALLNAARDRAGTAGDRLAAVLGAYAMVLHRSRTHADAELSALLHRRAHVASAERHLRDMVRDLIAASAESGEARDDVSAGELATYCLHALAAATTLESKAAVQRLLTVTLAGLRPQ
ncbi:MAG TPA: TetR/AcrR family transcriptional regulator [Acidimicrobiales bacterium]|nr:TetR/AcrR family transcriptional regulator [Acidimicrobiales bacterium]